MQQLKCFIGFLFSQKNGNVLYQVVWKQNSWVGQDELTHCEAALDKYEINDDPVKETCKDMSRLSLLKDVNDGSCQKQIKESKKTPNRKG